MYSPEQCPVFFGVCGKCLFVLRNNEIKRKVLILVKLLKSQNMYFVFSMLHFTIWPLNLPPATAILKNNSYFT